MKRDMFRKLMAAALATAMTAGLAGCGGEAPASTESSVAPSASTATSSEASVEPTEPAEPYPVMKDKEGNVYDFGGMEVVIRDWWSSGERGEATTDFLEAKYEYLDWAMEKYNFSIKELKMSEWADACTDLVDYVTMGGDENNYIFTEYAQPAVVKAMQSDIMYDLSSIDFLDFSDAKFTGNRVHDQYQLDGKIYCMAAGYSEPRTGMFFNKKLLKQAGIDENKPYDLQASGDWTWDAWSEMMDTIQTTIGDQDGDGVIDIYGFDANYGVPLAAAVFSNDSEYIGFGSDGYEYKIDDANTVQAINWMVDMFNKYAINRPEGANWDYYQRAFMEGECAFMPDQAYCGNSSGYLMEMTDEIGFVHFPKGPAASDYTNCWENNAYCIPKCYDKERAEKIAMIWNIYTAEIPGYEGYIDFTQYTDGKYDERACKETLGVMAKKGMFTYHGLVPDLDMNAPFIWQIGKGADVTAILDSVREPFKEIIAQANAN